MMVDETSQRIKEALVRREAQAERLASKIRLILLGGFAFVVLLNVQTVSTAASIVNFAALVVACAYGLAVYYWMWKGRYRPSTKYLTSLLDIAIVYLLLLLYTRIDIPPVALKNYVFLAVFPLITLTIFRYDPRLTWTSGAFAVVMYVSMVSYLCIFESVEIVTSGYKAELFSEVVTLVGQST